MCVKITDDELGSGKEGVRVGVRACVRGRERVIEIVQSVSSKS